MMSSSTRTDLSPAMNAPLNPPEKCSGPAVLPRLAIDAANRAGVDTRVRNETEHRIPGIDVRRIDARGVRNVAGFGGGCHWCDVKESWLAELHPPTETHKIVENAVKYSDTIVVTGGEPLTWDMTELTSQLKAKGVQTHILEFFH